MMTANEADLQKGSLNDGAPALLKQMTAIARLPTKPINLKSLLLFQLTCGTILTIKVLAGGAQIPGLPIWSIKLPLIAALAAGFALIVLELRRMVVRNRRVARQLLATSGAFAEFVDDHFTQWKLTPCEREVALLAIKGLSIGDIARLRQRCEGTVKSQCNAIFRKSGARDRAEFIGLFIEVLMLDHPASTGTDSRGRTVVVQSDTR